ncbi:ribosome-binding factor A, partial [Geodermatophilus sp. SYSU D00700]
MADPARARKLAVRIRQIVSSAIESQIKDPRLGMVTVTDARVTSDLREATVFYTVYGDATQAADSARGGGGGAGGRGARGGGGGGGGWVGGRGG